MCACHGAATGMQVAFKILSPSLRALCKTHAGKLTDIMPLVLAGGWSCCCCTRPAQSRRGRWTGSSRARSWRVTTMSGSPTIRSGCCFTDHMRLGIYNALSIHLHQHTLCRPTHMLVQSAPCGQGLAALDLSCEDFLCPPSLPEYILCVTYLGVTGGLLLESNTEQCIATVAWGIFASIGWCVHSLHARALNCSAICSRRIWHGWRGGWRARRWAWC